jgi:predicted nuclease of predicted toxin-antitoxin system
LRILLDENIPVQLKAIFHGHVVKSVNDKDVGWKNIKNGRLLAEMDGRFDLLITADRNIYTQQNLSGRRICILVLPANRRKDVLALGERIVEVVDGISVTEPEEDPALAPFLALLERDLAARPERLVALTPELAARITAATEGAEVDPDSPIEGEVEL